MPSSQTEKSRNIDVICDNISNNPQCYHGPTLRFRRRGDSESDYFACSACRDRKECSFYLKVKDQNSQKSLRGIRERRKIVRRISKFRYMKLRKLLKTLAKKRRGFCYSCCELFDASKKMHEDCVTILSLSKKQINQPTTIGPPKDNNKFEAQYFFTEETSSFVVNTLIRLGTNRVLCIGTPKIHEILTKLKIRSLLLDIDRKYHNFYTKRKFIWYNMFNNFTFNPKHAKILQNFLQEDGKMVVLMDPPFGGRIEPLAQTVKEIQKEYAVNNSQGKFGLKFSRVKLQVTWSNPRPFCKLATKIPASVKTRKSCLADGYFSSFPDIS